jgi:hypothetical protein
VKTTDEVQRRRAAYHELLARQFLRAFDSTCREIKNVLDRIQLVTDPPYELEAIYKAFDKHIILACRECTEMYEAGKQKRDQILKPRAENTRLKRRGRRPKK